MMYQHNQYFNKQPYTLTIVLTSDTLTLYLSEQNSYKQWQSTLDPISIQNLTSKMGNTKDFQTFTKMLVSSLENKTPDLQYDILTASQIETLRNAHKTTPFKDKENNSMGWLISAIEQIVK